VRELSAMSNLSNLKRRLQNPDFWDFRVRTIATSVNYRISALKNKSNMGTLSLNAPQNRELEMLRSRNFKRSRACTLKATEFRELESLKFRSVEIQILRKFTASWPRNLEASELLDFETWNLVRNPKCLNFDNSNLQSFEISNRCTYGISGLGAC